MDKLKGPEHGPLRSKNIGKDWEGWGEGREMKTLGLKGFGGKDGAMPEKEGRSGERESLKRS